MISVRSRLQTWSSSNREAVVEGRLTAERRCTGCARAPALSGRCAQDSRRSTRPWCPLHDDCVVAVRSALLMPTPVIACLRQHETRAAERVARAVDRHLERPQRVAEERVGTWAADTNPAPRRVRLERMSHVRPRGGVVEKCIVPPVAVGARWLVCQSTGRSSTHGRRSVRDAARFRIEHHAAAQPRP